MMETHSFQIYLNDNVPKNQHLVLVKNSASTPTLISSINQSYGTVANHIKVVIFIRKFKNHEVLTILFNLFIQTTK